MVSVLDFQNLYHRTNQIVRIVVVTEDPDEAALQAILDHGTLLYVFNLSPYYKSSFVSPDASRVKAYASDRLRKYFDITEEFLQRHVPDVVTLLKSERIVVSSYKSPDHLEVRFPRRFEA